MSVLDLFPARTAPFPVRYRVSFHKIPAANADELHSLLEEVRMLMVDEGNAESAKEENFQAIREWQHKLFWAGNLARESHPIEDEGLRREAAYTASHRVLLHLSSSTAETRESYRVAYDTLAEFGYEDDPHLLRCIEPWKQHDAESKKASEMEDEDG